MREREDGEEGEEGWGRGEGMRRGEGMGRGGSGEMVDTDKNSNAGVRYWQLTGDVTLSHVEQNLVIVNTLRWLSGFSKMWQRCLDENVLYAPHIVIPEITMMLGKPYNAHHHQLSLHTKITFQKLHKHNKLDIN